MIVLIARPFTKIKFPITETVAQIFPRFPLFDVVIFDEASQCRLEEAIPVLTRKPAPLETRNSRLKPSAP